MPYSKNETDWFGNDRVVHYSDWGTKIGYSKEDTDFWGKAIIQHYNMDDEKIGTSKLDSGLFDHDIFTQHYDKAGRKVGTSEEKEGFFGTKWTDHYDKAHRKQGVSRPSGLLSAGDVRHEGKIFPIPEKRQVAPHPDHYQSAHVAPASTNPIVLLLKVVGFLLSIPFKIALAIMKR